MVEADEVVAWRLPPTTRARLSLARGVLALVVLMAWVLAPSHRPEVLLGFAVLLSMLAVAELAAARALPGPARWPAVLRSLAPAAGAALLFLDPHPDQLAPAAGALLVVRGVGELAASAVVDRTQTIRSWLLGLGLAEALVGAAALVVVDVFGQAAVVLLGLGWLAGGLAVYLVPATGSEEGGAATATMGPLPRVETMSQEERRRIVREVFFGGAELRQRLVRFAVLLGIATTIATYGVLGDSVAAVIGAMIVAPLMLPIQALTAALVMGSSAQARVATIVLSAGVAGVLVLSMFLASTFRDLDVVLLSQQVSVRTSPSLTDLAVAVAAGLAGGFALLRRDVADSLPGVAVAVSLVPPLCVSGALLAGGRVEDAAGAFLLFAINFLAIVLASGAVLVMGGFGALADRSSNRLLTTAAAFGLALVALTVPLGVTGLDTLREETLTTATQAEVVRWLEPVQPAELLDLTVEGDRVVLLVTSIDRPPSPAALQEALSDATGRRVDLTVHWVAAEELD